MATVPISYTNTITGTSGQDTLSGTTQADYIDGLAGADAISSGAGDDFIVFDPNDSKIDGGTGFDTLLFKGTAQSLKLSNKSVTGIEQISLGGGGRHALALSATDLIRVSDTDVLTVWGDRSSTVDIGKGWNFSGFESIGGDLFSIFKSSGATLKTQFDLTVEGYSRNAAINAGSASVTESLSATKLTTQLTITVSDPNAGQNFLLPTILGATLGSLTFNSSTLANGVRSYKYDYQVDNSKVQYLAAGKTAVDKFTVTSFDGTTKTVSVTINGINTPASISNLPANGSSVTEDTANTTLTATGKLTVTDADTAQSSFQLKVDSVGTNLGTTTLLDSSGNYKYEVSNALVQYLGAGITKAETFSIYSQDGTSKNVTFTINGINDAPTVGTPSVSSVTEDTNVQPGNRLEAKGTIPIVDPDTNQSGFLAGTYLSGAGKLVLESSGTYTFSFDNAAAQSLGANEIKSISFSVFTADNSVATLNFTVNGTNDPANFNVAYTSIDLTQHLGTTPQYLQAAGTVQAIDTDNPYSDISVIPVSGIPGHLVIDSSYTTEPSSQSKIFSFVYKVLNDDIRYLAAGETLTETFKFVSTDGSEYPISFTITGINDPAQIGEPTNASVKQEVGAQGGFLHASGMLSILDPDHDQSSFQASSLTGSGIGAGGASLGTLSIEQSGLYDYAVLNERVRFLGEGETAYDTFTIVSSDGTTKNLTFTITGTNDHAVIGNPDNASVNQVLAAGEHLMAIGNLSVSDPDQNQSLFAPSGPLIGTDGQGGNSLGVLLLNANGSYEYLLDNELARHLGAGETAYDIFTVTSADGTTKDITFTINGIDDPVQISLAQGSITELTENLNVGIDGKISATGQLVFFDPDSHPSGLGNISADQNNFGSLYIDPLTLSYRYTVDNSKIQYLSSSQSAVDHFTVFSADGTGQLNLDFTIHASDPAQFNISYDVIRLDQIPNTTTPIILKAAGSIEVIDPDNPYSDISILTEPTNLGSVTIYGAVENTDNQSNIFFFEYNISNDSVRYLPYGVSRTEIFHIISTDGTEQDISFTVNGADDKTIISDLPVNVDGVSSVTEDVNVDRKINGNFVYAAGQLSYSDPDQGQTSQGLVAMNNAQGTNSLGGSSLGTLTLDINGNYLYTVSNDRIQFLHGGESVADSFTVTSVDGGSKTINFTLNGTTDTGLNFSGDTVKTTLYGSDGNDTITGTFIAETIYGFDGDDNLAGVGTNNILFGGAGNDTLRGGSGSDKLYGGSGNDQYFAATADSVFEDPNDGIDTVLSTTDFTLPDNVENLTIQLHPLQASVTGTGNALDNTMVDSTGNEILSGGDGNDTLTATGGIDTLRGGNGNDTIFAKNTGDGISSASYSNIFGDAGNDVIFAQTGFLNIFGGDGSDTIDCSNSARGTILGDAGNDKFIFNAKSLVDLYGGSGADTFQLRTTIAAEGVPVIHDFNMNGGDTLDLPGDPLTYIYAYDQRIPGGVNISTASGALVLTLIASDFDPDLVANYINAKIII
jgi:VCBS repeat-containing protein